MKSFLILFLSIVFFCTLNNCNREFKGGGDSKKHTFHYKGENRSYRLYLPKDYDESTSYPMVLALHGRYGKGKQLEKSSLFNPLADQYGIIIVYPDGYKKSWNDGRGEGPATADNIDDVGFIETLIYRLKGDYPVDPAKIYACGMSNGGFMSMRLAHELSDIIAAFGTVTGSLGSNYNEILQNQVPILLIAGTEDPLVPYGGGEVAESGTFSVGFEDLLAYYADHNNCNELTKQVLPNKEDDGIRAEKWEYTSCEEDATCVLFKIKGAGHTWPSGKSNVNEDIVGKSSFEINASEELIQFFLSHSL